MKRRIVTLVLAFALVLGSLYTGQPVGTYAANEEVQEQMTDVILKVKTKLELPDEYTEFSSNYNNYGEKATWYFNWSTADGSKSLYVNCDDESHILYMGSYSNGSRSGIPDKTADDLKATADKLLARVFPEAKGHVVLKNTAYQYYRSAYRFLYRRIENNIEMPDNYIALSIDYKTGDLIAADCSWNYTAAIPSADKLISADEAKAKIDKQLDMELYYYVTVDNEGNDRVYLAYTPSASYIAADAKSGKIYTKKNYWGDDPEMGNDEDMEESAKTADNGRGYEPQLSEAELKRIGELENLISSDDAVKIIKSSEYLLVDENINSVTANLREYNGKYTWNITLRDNRPEDYDNDDYYRAYARASIDAHDGKILSYSASTKSLYYYSDQDIDGIKFNYSKKECRNIFEKFVKSIEDDKFSKVKLTTAEPEMQYYKDVTGDPIVCSYGFTYTRYNDDIPFMSNGISGAVDRITGKVYSYYLNWTDAEVPSAKNVIGEAKAYDAYMSYEGFDLVYEIVNKYENTGSMYGYDNEQIVRLVYRTAINPAFVDAFTGKQLNYSGEEYEDTRTDYNYNDIAGTKYEKAIKILAGMGIGLPGESFNPSQKIKADELASLIAQMPMLGYTDMTKILSGEKSLSRQEAAKAIVTAMGLEPVAKLDIYKLSYKDKADVKKGYTGYVAIAGAMGLFGSAKAKKFKPKAALTRGEAAQLVLNAASVIASYDE